MFVGPLSNLGQLPDGKYPNAPIISPIAIEKGLKYDENKPRIDLVDPSFLEGLGAVLGFGAEKYAAHNWRNGIDASRLIGAAYRHLGALNKGEDLDPESGLNHAYHLGCCVMFLAWTLQNLPERDDRYKQGQ